VKNAKQILFNDEMVRAIRDGRKIQTRRLMKEWKEVCTECCERVDREYHDCTCGVSNSTKIVAVDKPKYKKGDILYVRETFQEVMCKKDNDILVPIFRADYPTHWEAVNAIYGDTETDHETEKECRWKPSLHMPKKYARIFLRVTNVRVQRVQDVTVNDVSAEGIDITGFDWLDRTNHCKVKNAITIPEKKVLNAWINLWNSVAKDGYKWEDNPFVFVYDFERIEK